MKYAAIGPIGIYLPERVESNELLRQQNPDWEMELIESKTGIAARHIAAADQCASDLGVAAAENLFREHGVDRDSIDFLLFCTQSPDYPLPTTACLVQDRLGLRQSIGALDFNLGCSGFVYGLAVADGLIRSGAANKILLITAETYSKYIDKADRSLRTIFGDGAAATLIESSSVPSLRSFRFGTDGSGANTLLVNEGGARDAEHAIQPKRRRRWESQLYMDGPSLITFGQQEIPKLVNDVLGDAHMEHEDVELYLMHQATRKMLDILRTQIDCEEDQLPVCLENYGNTVSATLPILIHDLRRQGRLRRKMQTVMAGFGVGLSWAGCAWKETWAGEAAASADQVA